MSTKLLNIAETGTVMDTFLTLGNLVIKTQADRPIKKKKMQLDKEILHTHWDSA